MLLHLTLLHWTVQYHDMDQDDRDLQQALQASMRSHQGPYQKTSLLANL